jgi:hypothetical protein
MKFSQVSKARLATRRFGAPWLAEVIVLVVSQREVNDWAVFV